MKSRGSKVRLKPADWLLKGKVPYVSLGKVPYGYPAICSSWLYNYPVWVFEEKPYSPSVLEVTVPLADTDPIPIPTSNSAGNVHKLLTL